MRFTRSRQTYRHPVPSSYAQEPWLLRHRWVLGVIVVIFVGGFAYCLYGLPVWRITTLEVQGTYALPLEELRSVTKAQLRGRWMLFFSQDSLWAFDARAYERRLREKWLFSSVDIQKHMPGTIRLVITEEQPAFTIARPDGFINVDRQGVASTLTREATPGIPQLILESSPDQLPVGSTVMTAVDASFIVAFTRALADRGDDALRVRTVTLSAPPSTLIRLRVAGEWDIILDRLGDYDAQLSALTTAYDQKIQGTKVEYVDVTVPSRVYVK